MGSARQSVVFVLSGYGAQVRGAEQVVRELATRLDKVYDVTVLGRGGDAPCAVPIPAIPREHRLTRAMNRTPGLGHALRALQIDPLNWEWLSASWSAWRWLQRHPCDLLIPEGGRWGGWLGRAWRARAGVPFLDIAHGAPGRWEEAAARQRPDRYVSPTQVSAECMTRRVPGLRAAVIPLGVDRRVFCPDGPRADTGLEAPIALAVGALEPVKRMDAVIEAVARWGRGSLLLVGEGPLAPQLEAQGLARLGERRFRRVTARPEAMPAWYRAADVLVSASRSEAFGLVYLEAMACGLPVATQDDPIRREVVGAGGHFCETPDPEAFARAIETALAGPDHPPAIRDWDDVAADFHHLIREVLSASAR